MTKKVLLMTPPYHTGIIEITGNWTPLNLVYLAGHLRAEGHKVEIYDAMTKNHSTEEVRQQISHRNPDIVMIGAYTASVNCALDILNLTKKDNPQIITCLGGVHATFCYEEILTELHNSVDVIIRGEGEKTAVELTNALEAGDDLTEIKGLAFYREGRVIKTPDRDFVDSLDDLIPAWDLLEWEDYFFKLTDRRLAVVSSSRGCNHNCRFCSQHLFWKGIYRERTPENFVAEIEFLHRTYGVGMYMLADEYTTKNRERWETILDLLIEKGMDIHFSLETRVDDILRDEDILWKYRLAGMIHIYVGVEAANQDTLVNYDKQITVEQSKKALDILNKAEIITECSFIMGGPDETLESMDSTLQTAIDFNPDLAHFLFITPWPYAEIYKELEPYITEKDYSKYHFVYPVVKPKSMGINEVWDKLIDCFRVFYMDKAKQYTLAPEGIKKQYMLKAIQIMHTEFFTTNFGKSVIKPPEGLTPHLIVDSYINVSRVKGDLAMMYKFDAMTKEELDSQIHAFVDKGIDYSDEEKFNDLAIKEFVHQYNENDYYRSLCDTQGISPDQITNWSEIPAVATQAFKQSIIASFPLAETELALLTSGTTNPDARGKIYRDKSSLDIIMKCNHMLTKEFLFPDVDRMRILLLVPSPKVAPGMPMAFGLEQARKEFGTEDSEYYISPRGLAVDELIAALLDVQQKNEPVCLMGATSGFVFFFNACNERSLKFQLPIGSRVCDGGGYMGTFGECSRDQYYALVEEYLAIHKHMCVNTLGMGESGTNYFDNLLRDHNQGKSENHRYKPDLPWTRTTVVGIRTGKRLPKGELGLIRHYDLTNRATVLAVQTDNLGYETDNGFEIIGRAGSISSNTTQSPGGMVKDWLFGVGKYDPAQTGNADIPKGHPAHIMGGHPAHIFRGHPSGAVGMGLTATSTQQGNPCSTVADGMMQQGNPCSTVADGMMQQGNPCSTVADGMLKHNVR